MKILLLFFISFLFLSCQQSASSNKDLSNCPQNVALKYPLKTGQQDIFVFEDITTNPPTFYYDDGYEKRGYSREFERLADGTVLNRNYNLYWQDDDAMADFNITAAKNYCQDLNLSGYNDWRLPNIYELLTLLDLNSRVDVRESLFVNMPSGNYYTSNEQINGDSTYVLGFGIRDFNITKMDNRYNDSNTTINPLYGQFIGASQVPAFNATGTLLSIVDTQSYYDGTYLTVLTTHQFFDANGTLTSEYGPVITQTQPTVVPKIKTIPKAYTKCVRGEEISSFKFVRDDKNGVVVDNATALMWQDNQDIIEKRFQWGEAVKYCSALNLAGYNDWRVPTISELVTIVDFKLSGTYAVDSVFLFKSANKFHSSSNLCYGANCNQKNLQLNACGYLEEKITQNIEVDRNPYDTNKSEPYFQVRCVRCGGQS